jgi:protein-S-isoprenylcysteine O-methyltransferase Ste14
MVVGLSIRIYSMRKLNKSYTRILQTTEQQKLYTGGLYKIIRHPGYLGTILIWIYFGFAIENYIVIFIAIPMTFISYTYRIKSEEKMLLNQFGQEYADYQKKSWRLIPYIW